MAAEASTYAGRVAVITGGASGIGLAVARKCVAQGTHVVLGDVRPEALTKAKAELESLEAKEAGVTAGKVHTTVTDVTSLDSMKNLQKEAVDTFSRIDFVFLNAGVFSHNAMSIMKNLQKEAVDTFSRIDFVFLNAGVFSHNAMSMYENYEASRWVLDVNVFGVLNGTHAFVPTLEQQAKDGHANATYVVVTSSVAGLRPVYDGCYGISKHAARAIAESLHFELEKKGFADKIKVLTLTPGLLKTGLVASTNETRSMKAVGDSDVEKSNKSGNFLAELLEAKGLDPNDLADDIFKHIEEGKFYVHTDFDRSKAAVASFTKSIITDQVPCVAAGPANQPKE